MATGKKRGLVYGVIGVMLCAAIYLNWSYVQSPEEWCSFSMLEISRDSSL